MSTGRVSAGLESKNEIVNPRTIQNRSFIRLFTDGSLAFDAIAIPNKPPLLFTFLVSNNIFNSSNEARQCIKWSSYRIYFTIVVKVKDFAKCSSITHLNWSTGYLQSSPNLSALRANSRRSVFSATSFSPVIFHIRRVASWWSFSAMQTPSILLADQNPSTAGKALPMSPQPALTNCNMS